MSAVPDVKKSWHFMYLKYRRWCQRKLTCSLWHLADRLLCRHPRLRGGIANVSGASWRLFPNRGPAGAVPLKGGVGRSWKLCVV